MTELDQALRVQQRLADFARQAVGATDTRTAVEHIVEDAKAALAIEHAGVMVQSRRELTLYGTADPVVAQADRLQMEFDEGPCLDAARHIRTVYSGDVEADPRWPRWGPVARRLGVRAVVSARLFTGSRTWGALNLYHDQPVPVAAADAELADLFAAHAAVAIEAAHRSETLGTALASRTRIGQAQGIVMAVYGVDAEQAFQVLRRYSQEKNVKLHDLAAQVIAARQLPDTRAIRAAERAGQRAGELAERLERLKIRRPVTPADVAAANDAVRAAADRAAEASERTAERKMHAHTRHILRTAPAVHAELAAGYRVLAELEPENAAQYRELADIHEQ